MFPKFEAA